jgi:hypothetical protein
MKTITITMTEQDALTLNDYLEQAEMDGIFNDAFSVSVQDFLDNADLSAIKPLPSTVVKALNIER